MFTNNIMSKKNKISKLTNKDEEFFEDKSLKERKFAVNGKPDISDRNNLQLLFDLYNKHTFNQLKRFCDQLAVERAFNNRDSKFIAERGVLGDKLSFALPQELQIYMERWYPTIWTNPEHARWFIKTFPRFRK